MVTNALRSIFYSKGVRSALFYEFACNCSTYVGSRLGLQGLFLNWAQLKEAWPSRALFYALQLNCRRWKQRYQHIFQRVSEVSNSFSIWGDRDQKDHLLYWWSNCCYLDYSYGQNFVFLDMTIAYALNMNESYPPEESFQFRVAHFQYSILLCVMNARVEVTHQGFVFIRHL